ncbi:MAG TPA: hypothetical protein VI542_12330 [Candidatus Tectomicrobia bacterium]
MPWAHHPMNIMQEGRDAEDADAGHCIHGSIDAHFGRAPKPIVDEKMEDIRKKERSYPQSWNMFAPKKL